MVTSQETRVAGDNRAVDGVQPFEALVRQHFPLVYGTCLRILKNRHDAEDATQAVFLSLAVQLRQNVAIRSPGSWLYQVACRTSLDLHRRRRRRVRHESEGAALSRATLPAPADPAGELELQHLRGLVLEALHQLPPKYRMPLVFHCLGGMTRQEMAAELNLSMATLRVRLYRGHQLLRESLEGRGVSLAGGSLGALIACAVQLEVADAILGRTVNLAGYALQHGVSHCAVSAEVLAACHAGAGRSAFSWKLVTLVGAAAIGALSSSPLLARLVQALPNPQVPRLQNVMPLKLPTLEVPLPKLSEGTTAPPAAPAPATPLKPERPASPPAYAITPAILVTPAMPIVPGITLPPPDPHAAAAPSASASGILPYPSPHASTPLAPAPLAGAFWIPPAPAQPAPAQPAPAQPAPMPEAFPALMPHGSIAARQPSDPPLPLSRPPTTPPQPVLPEDQRNANGVDTPLRIQTYPVNPLLGPVDIPAERPVQVATIGPASVSPWSSTDLPVHRTWDNAGLPPESFVVAQAYTGGKSVDTGVLHWLSVDATFQYGAPPPLRILNNNGQVLSDSPARIKDYRAFDGITNTLDNPATGGVNGWFARNGGKVLLPSITVTRGTRVYTWGEDPADKRIDLINSVRFQASDVSQATDVDIALLACEGYRYRQQTLAYGTNQVLSEQTITRPLDAPVLPGGHHFIGLWKIDGTQTITGGLDLTIRYDDARIAYEHLPEDQLKLWYYDSGWHRVTDESFFLDQNLNHIGGHVPGTIGYFAVSTPEPGAVFFITGAAALGLLRRRRP